MIKNILFVSGGVLLGWGIYCWYTQDKNKQKDVTGAASSTETKTAPATQQSGLMPPGTKPQAELVISDEPLTPAPLEQSVQYYDTSPSALFYRPRTTISVPADIAQNVITIDSANTYSR